MRFLFTALVLLALAPPGRAANAPQVLAAQARQVLKTHCYRCHSGEGSSSGYTFDVTKHDSLTKKLGDDEPMIVANSLAKSPLWDAVQKRMPQKGSSERDSFGDAERKVIEKWIVAGAPPFPEAAARPFRTLKAELTAARDHLAKAQPEDRKFLRFFTLANPHNDPRTTDEDLRYHRAALSKVLNSLSWAKPIVVPESVDKSDTLYAVNVKDLDWHAGDQWKMLVDAYPYGLKYGSHPDRDLRELDKEIVRDTGTQLPILRTDWFIATASRPPLYHDLLKLPKNAKVLEEELGVDIPANFKADKLMRAGFAKSGVSGQNRMVERHESKYGAYWKSYDFFPETGRANLTRFPLGPNFEHHPFPNQVFKHDGGEIIFNLPNGLQAYLLVDNKDERIDAGPIDIVGDDKRVSGTPAIVNGISCMACHSQGMIGFTDQIRDSHAVFGEASEKTKRLYPEKKKFDARIEQDKKRFTDALDKAVGSFLKVGADKDTPLGKFKEPVTEVSIPYRRGYLDLKAVAAELYLEKPDDVLKKIGEKKLKELGLEPLGKPGGLVGRYQWEAVDGVSLMQEVARELSFTPLR